jgi:hypothetical protein
MADFEDGFGADIPVAAQNNVDDIDDGFGFAPAQEAETEGVAHDGSAEPVEAAAPEADAGDLGVFGFADEGKGDAAAPNEEDVFGLGAMGVSEVPEEPASSDAFAKWTAEHEKFLRAKADRLRKEKDEEQAAAKRELEEFYAKRDAAVKKAKATNRSEEKQWRADLEATNAHGTQWEKVAKYCDLKPKAEGKGGQPHKTERMRKVLVTLKNDKQ